MSRPKIQVLSPSSYLDGTIGSRHNRETQFLRNEFRKLFKNRPVSIWVHAIADFMIEEAAELKATSKDRKQLLSEASAIRKVAYETHYSRR